MNAQQTIPAELKKTETVDVDGTEIAFRRFGNAGARPLFLLPRFRGTMDDWDPHFLIALAENREVITFDTFGVGASSGSSPAAVPEMADNAARVIRRIANGPVDVLGWSLGGLVGLSLALRRPEAVHHLIVAASTPGGVRDARPAPEKVWQVASKPINDVEDFLYLFFPETDAGREAGLAHLERLGAYRGESQIHVKAETVKAQFGALMATREADEMLSLLDEIRSPVLLANGIDDIMIDAYASYAAAAKLPDAKCVIYPKSGHGFLFQLADEFVPEVDRFLDG